MIKNKAITGRTVPVEYGHQKEAPKMQYVRLGNSGLKVSRLIFGTATYGTKADVAWRIEEEEALKHLQRAWELGFNTFDTSNFYCNGVSEEILGKFLKTVPREAAVVMTKCHFPIGDSSKSGPAGLTLSSGNNRKHIFDNVKQALKRLQTDYIDVMLLHRFDYETPIEETMQALHGIFHAMQNYAISNRLTPFIVCQNFYNLLYREEEREMMPLLKYLGVGSTPWSPMAKGQLTRPLEKAYETVCSTSDAYHDEAILGVEWEREVTRRVEELANKRGLPMANIALAWVLHTDCVAAPIVGCSKIERIEKTLAALDVELSEEEIRYLEEPYQPFYLDLTTLSIMASDVRDSFYEAWRSYGMLELHRRYRIASV
ncbi:Aldo/keto reductase [Aspergillus sclerotiicarbonarius CBS 121057]|uniref:Aldo/keto reductase n=1 Tax=Aspergillus sclerotiicarbonarius (strain CBS 121057 / IBT 28362) TaxID=1448318 RepID=A0A319FDY0_ASPSB|nr:Aldo/keto reductase [Aspergillus sclerotiicarbonarius CBS 121057]